MNWNKFVNYMYANPWRLRLFMLCFALPAVAILGVFALLIDIADNCQTFRGAYREYTHEIGEIFHKIRTGRE